MLRSTKLQLDGTIFFFQMRLFACLPEQICTHTVPDVKFNS
jgi:hypothetical protein